MRKLLFRGYIKNNEYPDGRHVEVYRVSGLADKNENGYYRKVFLTASQIAAIDYKRHIRQFNIENGTRYKVIEEKSKTGKTEYYLEEKLSNSEAIRFIKENKAQNYTLKNYSYLNNSQAKVKNTSNLKKIVAGGLIAASLIGATAFFGSKIGGSDIKESDKNIPASSESFIEQNPESSYVFKPEESIIDQLKTNWDNLSFKDLTYTTTYNSKGNEMVEIADMLKISYVCYNELVRELNAYNASVPESKRLDFDVEKFNFAMFAGQGIKESSLVVPKNDQNDSCRGLYKIGDPAAEEANKISRKLTGKDILTSESDRYDPRTACMAAMYISVQNYEYVAGVETDKNIKQVANKVLDCYLMGCGNIRKDIRNNNFSANNYSKLILAYSECLNDYANALRQGLTDGSHDEYWSKCYNGLNKALEDIRDASQMGE